MKKLVIFSLIAAGTVLAAAAGERLLSSTSNLTAGALTSADFSTTNSFDLDDVSAFRVTVCHNQNNILNGGQLDPYLFNKRTANISKNPDLALQVGTPSTACRNWSDQRVGVYKNFRLRYVPSGMTALDAGTTSDAGTVTVYINGVTNSTQVR